MFFQNQTRTRRAVLPTIVLITLVAAIVAAGAAAPAAAQTDTVDNATDSVDNATDAVSDDEDETTNDGDRDDIDSIIYQFEGGGELVSVDQRDGSTFVTVEADGRQQFAIAEGGLDESGSFEFEQVTVSGKETIELPVETSDVVVTTTSDGYYYSDSTLLTVLLNSPTVDLIQLAGLSGIVGSITAFSISIGRLKRKNENTYTELFSDEKQRVEEDAYEGAKDRILGWLSDRFESKLSSIVGFALLVYISGLFIGVLSSPAEIWYGFSDGQRLLAAATVVATIIALPATYILANRIYNPTREYVLDLDSEQVYQSAGGNRSGGIAAYSAPPSRISDLEVDGSTTAVSTPGGTCHIVRNMDPETNTAEGNPPEVADDRDAIIKASHIRTNREIMEDMADVARSIIGYLPAMRVNSDFNAMSDIDQGLSNVMSIGQDSIDQMMAEAFSETAYEGRYNDSVDDIEDEADELSETMNDPDETTNDEGGSTDE